MKKVIFEAMGSEKSDILACVGVMKKITTFGAECSVFLEKSLGNTVAISDVFVNDLRSGSEIFI